MAKINKKYNFFNKIKNEVQTGTLIDRTNKYYMFLVEDIEVQIPIDTKLFESGFDKYKLETLRTVSNENFEAIISRKELIDTYEDMLHDSVLIFLPDPGEEKLNPSIFQHFKENINMEFYGHNIKDSEYSSISETQISELNSFILKNIQQRFVLVCETGIDKSAAIGLAIEALKKQISIVDLNLENSSILGHSRYSINRALSEKLI